MNKKSDSNQKNQRIQVFARCRPLNSREKSQGSPSIVEVVPEKKEIAIKDRNNRREFFFDKVFPAETKQIAVYKSVVEPLIQEVLMGYNCTVFAYGQTGTGKTYTMEGERNNTHCSWEDDPGAGIIPRSLHQLFEELNEGENVEFSVRVSFLELYNEELFDLLGSSEFSKLRLYEDPIKKGSVIIQGLEEIPVNSKDEVYAILERGTSRRQTAATMLNATSSRSHTVFSVTVHIKENTVEGEELLKTGKLNLVDLAGSENVGRSGAVDKRAREAGNINQSLLTLGRVITALIEKQPHVPYRESKLTRLLQDSLGGHTKTSIIATISPAQLNLDETISTLDYATKAKSITIKPEANQKMTKRALIREYTEEIERLRKDLVALRRNEGFYIDSDNYTNMMREITEKSDMIKELNDKIEAEIQKNMMIEQDISAIKDELSKRTQQYEETASKLSQTTKSLNFTQKVLSKTTRERDEKGYLLNVHCNTEKILSQQAQTLLQVTHQTTDDIYKLHEKLDRKQKVEQTNEERSENFKIMYQKQFENLDKLVNEIKCQQFQNLDGIEETLDQVSSDLNSVKQKFTDLLHNIAAGQGNELNKFSQSLGKDVAEQTKWANALLEDLKSKKNALSAEQQTFLTETFPQLLNQLCSIHAEVESLVLNKHDVLIQKIKQHHHAIKTKSENKITLIKEIHSNLDSFHEHHEALLKDLEEKTNSLSLLQESRDEDFARKKKELYLQLDAFFMNHQKEENILKERIAEIGSLSRRLNDDSTELKLKKEPLHSLENMESESATDCLALDDITNTFEINEFTSKHNSVSRVQKSVSSEVIKFIQNNQKIEESTFNEIENAVVHNISTVQTNFETVQSKLKGITVSLSQKVENEDLLIKEQNSNLVGKISHTETLLNNSKEQLNHLAGELKKEIVQRDLEFEKFIDEDLQKDIPTGTTPQRKNYEYPKSLAVTSPDDRILQKLRSICEDNTNVAVNLPFDSSFEESEEFKSPVNLEVTELANGNTSFNSEEDYLTSCETVSNASSMSDLSVDGIKNKENLKHHSKQSHLPKLKKFAEPTKPVSGRKPLYSKNP